NPNTSITDSINNWSIDSIHSGQINDTAGVMNGPNFGLTPGIHIGYVIDKNGCVASDTVMITEPDPLTVVIQDTATVYSYCTGTNSAYLYSIASGGIEPYNYVWSDPLGQTTQWADDLMAGTYTVVVLDDNGCSASDTRVIDTVTNSMDASTAVTNISCFGLFDGSTLVDNVWGAVPLTNTGNLAVDYDYSWTGPNGYTAHQQQINFLYAGNYGVTITDSNNCSITIYTDVQEPDLLSYTLYDITGETCYGSCNGSISVDVNGGTSPYYWDEDMLGNSPFTNPISLVNDSLILDLCNGDYDIYVTDENDCIGTVVWGGVWQATIDSGFVVSVSAPNITQSPSCYNSNDGHANVFWWDQNPLFTYTWETLNGDVVDIGTHTTILSGGDYNLVAHYADSANFGQIYTACDATVQFNMPSPSQILANESIVTIACYGDANGSISLVPSGGSGSNYTYQWDTTTSVPNGSTNSSINGLQEATYTVTITDGDGCTETIDYPLIEPDPLTNDFNPIVNASCNGDNDGSIKANISGGTPIYSYSWSPSGGNNQTANSLTAGNYTVTVTDSRSCTESFDITITEPDAIISGVEPNAFYGNDATGTISYNISCNGLSDGSAIVNLGGGTAPYTFSWTTGGFDQLETGMPAGTHTVTVTDNQGCYEDMDITLVEPDLLIVNGTSTGNYTPFPGGFDISCKGLNDGECYADPTGGVPGTPGYMYSWSGPIGGQISNLDEITNLYVGTYSITVTDANECTTSQTFILTEPTDYFIAETHLVNYAGAAVSPVTADFQDNTISVDQYDYTFYWPIGDSIDVINVTNLTDFQELSFMEIGENEVYIKVQNMNSGCIDDTTFIIEVQGIPEIHNVFTPNGDGTNDYFDFGEFAMKEIDVSIYNRWGEMVINWQDSNHQWDGRGIDGQDLPEGVYYYVLIATGEDGYDYQKKGSITLLR
ncbi:MAG: T9SS type B sorting domain-containing protein, partial [Flavobacteriales bacterium]|nr:T9SS type B sorting domain-containing protein [Flavobacteriales bacterium]